MRQSGEHVSNREGSAIVPGRNEPLALAEIVDGAGYAVMTESLDGIVTTWNKAAEVLFGLRPTT